MITYVLVGVLVIVIVVSFYLFKSLNRYIAKLEKAIEVNVVITENLKQSLRDILLDSTFLLDDGKLRPMPIQKERVAIINGVRREGAILDEESVGL